MRRQHAANRRRRPGLGPARRRLLAAVLPAATAVLGGLTAGVPAQAVGEPTNTDAPRVTRTENTLVTTNGAWLAADPTRFSYSWLRCASTDPATCGLVPGRTAHTYALTSDDAGRVIRSRVTSRNDLGSAFADSEPFGPLSVSEPLPPPPAPDDDDPADARRLSPFPVVVIAGRIGPRLTRVRAFVVRGPRAALIRVRCRGSRRVCPMRSARRRIPRSKRLRMRSVQRTYRPGAVLDVRVTGPDRIGKFTRIRFRRDRTPRRVERCLEPGNRKPVLCD